MATPKYRICIVGCGRMGGTIDEEVRATPHGALPYSHAAGYTACGNGQLSSPPLI